MVNSSIPYHNVGISQIGFSIPQSYVDINELAEARGIIPDKLTKGLGLKKMAVCKEDETIDVLIANALEDLWRNSANHGDTLDSFLKDVDRIYLGTESAIDGAKPSVTYGLNTLSKRFDFDYSHIDVVDLTFACIGSVDALHNCIDYVRLNLTRKCIVVAADIAKYDLNSGGEYTQGAGAMAYLIENNPRLVEYSSIVGVDTKADFDFFKPLMKIKKEDIANDISQQLNLDDDAQAGLNAWLNPTESPNDGNGNEGALNGIGSIPGDYIPVLRKEPVYNGAYSNKCYKDRMGNALNRFLNQGDSDIQNFEGWVFHLPFCYQGRKIAIHYWFEHVLKKSEDLKDIVNQIGEVPEENSKEFAQWLKGVSKTDIYKRFAEQRIASGEWLSAELGNMYTASIFFSLMSFIAQSEGEQSEILQMAYGSGSKSKVLAARITCAKEARLELKNRFQDAMNSRVKLGIEEYECIHRAY